MMHRFIWRYTKKKNQNPTHINRGKFPAIKQPHSILTQMTTFQMKLIFSNKNLGIRKATLSQKSKN